MNKAAIGAIMKGETPYIFEWVAYYKLLGFDLIIADNGGDPEQSELLSSLHKAGIIYRIDFRWKKHKPQFAANRALIRFARSKGYDVLGILDIDEFFTRHFPVQSLCPEDGAEYILHEMERHDASQISFHWICYGSEATSKDISLPCLERFETHSRPDEFWNVNVKSFFKLNETRRKSDVFYLGPQVFGAHHFAGARRKWMVEGRQVRHFSAEWPVSYQTGAILHFQIKTFEEYQAKISKGDVAFRNNKNSPEYFKKHDYTDLKTPIDPGILNCLKEKISELKKLCDADTDKPDLKGIHPFFSFLLSIGTSSLQGRGHILKEPARLCQKTVSNLYERLTWKKEKTDFETIYHLFGIRIKRLNKKRLLKRIREINGGVEYLWSKQNDMPPAGAIISQQEKIDALSEKLSYLETENQNLYKALDYPLPSHSPVDHWSLMNYCYQGGENYYMKHPAVNIGDYIQSIAARQFLPRVDGYISRDHLSYYNGPKTGMIMNGWWWMFEGVQTLPDSVSPFFIAYHINNKNDISSDTLDYLRRHEPIGCRDITTQKELIRRGIKAYFSGCLTLTLGSTYQIQPDDKGKIIFCDFDMDENEAIRNYLMNNFADTYSFRNAEKVTHIYDINLPEDERFRIADDLLRKYTTASLVITSRIHCALPCLGMGVPVILIPKSYDEKRYPGLIELLNHIYIKEDTLHTSILESEDAKGHNVIVNPALHLPLKKRLIEKVTNFIQYSDLREKSTF